MVEQPSTSSIHIRALRPEEVDLHREVRLRALSDAPNSFGGTLDVEESKPWEYWEAQARALTDPGRNVMFLASAESSVLGMVYGLRHRDRSDESRVGGMWVDPLVRRQGIGGKMLSAVVRWARERHSSRLGLWAPSDSVAAISFYRGMGFRETANRDRLRADSELQIVEMMYDL